jgi:hypothetical protein
MKETWFDGERAKSPLLPLYKRGKSNPGPPLCKEPVLSLSKEETEGISHGACGKFLRSFDCLMLAVDAPAKDPE